MRLVVGLGNPGPKYEGNRHNIGFMAADEIVRRHGFGPWRARFQGQCAEGQIADTKLLVLKPATFMNESGRAVGEAVRFFKIAPEDVLVIYDELDLALGKLRVKQDGGHGGHNGLKSLDAHIGKAYWRLRLGISHPGAKEKVIHHVLGDFAKAERATVDRVLDAVGRHVPLLIDGRHSDFMSKAAMDIAADAEADRAAKSAAKAPAAKKGTSAAERLLAEREAEADKPAGIADQLKNLFRKDR